MMKCKECQLKDMDEGEDRYRSDARVCECEVDLDPRNPFDYASRKHAYCQAFLDGGGEMTVGGMIEKVVELNERFGITGDNRDRIRRDLHNHINEWGKGNWSMLIERDDSDCAKSGVGRLKRGEILNVRLRCVEVIGIPWEDLLLIGVTHELVDGEVRRYADGRVDFGGLDVDVIDLSGLSWGKLRDLLSLVRVAMEGRHSSDEDEGELEPLLVMIEGEIERRNSSYSYEEEMEELEEEFDFTDSDEEVEFPENTSADMEELLRRVEEAGEREGHGG